MLYSCLCKPPDRQQEQITKVRPFDMNISHVFPFLWAVINNWAIWATGGLVMGGIFLWQTFSKKGEVSKWVLKACCLLFLAVAIFQAWDEQYISAATNQKLLDDKSPKLDGFISQTAIVNEPGTTNSLVFIEPTIINSGGTPTVAHAFDLKIIATNKTSLDAENVDFENEFKLDFFSAGKEYLVHLKRPQLLSEKTLKAIGVGDQATGWLPYRVPRSAVDISLATNKRMVLSYSDKDGKRLYITNGIWKGKQAHDFRYTEIPLNLPGTENIFTRIAAPPQTNTAWLPPELPPGCSNVIIFFGTSGNIYPRLMAGFPGEQGTKFAIRDLPDFFLSDLEKVPNYSPREQNIWVRLSAMFSNGGKTLPYPVQPVVISNRLYVELEIPFSNAKHKLVMSDSFDSELPIPRLWDRNYSTNYDANSGIYVYEVVNELKNPVLQVVYTAPNEVHVNGIFQVDTNSILAAFGQQPRLITFSISTITQGLATASLQAENFHETLTINSNETITSFGQRLTNEFFRPIFTNQRPIFKYPSSRYLGEFVN